MRVLSRTDERGRVKGFDTLPPANQFQLGAVSSLGADDDRVHHERGDEGRQTNAAGGLVQLVFHRVCTSLRVATARSASRCSRRCSTGWPPSGPPAWS